jgi:hypothetical protein
LTSRIFCWSLTAGILKGLCIIFLKGWELPPNKTRKKIFFDRKTRKILVQAHDKFYPRHSNCHWHEVFKAELPKKFHLYLILFDVTNIVKFRFIKELVIKTPWATKGRTRQVMGSSQLNYKGQGLALVPYAKLWWLSL